MNKSLPLRRLRKRRTGVPSGPAKRMTWLLVTLLYDNVAEYSTYEDIFGAKVREFQRDLQKLRALGRDHGFSVSHMKAGRVFMHQSARRISPLIAKNRDTVAMLGRILRSLGGPIAHEFRAAILPEGTVQGFLHLREPLPNSDEHVTRIFEFLKNAASSCARVEFSYRPIGRERSVRRVEPYLVIARSARYYLVAYDMARRGWRQFALDAIEGPMRREGTFAPQRVPGRFLAERAVGWISGSQTTEVTIRATQTVAGAIAARVWQEGQRITHLDDGGLEITLKVDDLDEAVRWALGFGAEAQIIAPVAAVSAAQRIVGQIARHYAAGTAPVSVRALKEQQRRMTG